MSRKIPSLRSALGRARGLGSAKHGVEHWWAQRMTALALIPLSIYGVAAFFNNVVGGGYADAVVWLHSPFAAVLVILFILVAFHHAASGVQVVIEDYVHCEAVKLASIIAVKFLASAFALLGTIAVIKILFSVSGALPHV